ncbi:expressed unknown protein [Seminavis robusta]|nr:expressed unknown protein [Seminavis robusta]|eukprot:Sro4174_g353270.1 n/a (180) ;mRNA; f:1085-1624
MQSTGFGGGGGGQMAQLNNQVEPATRFSSSAGYVAQQLIEPTGFNMSPDVPNFLRDSYDYSSETRNGGYAGSMLPEEAISYDENSPYEISPTNQMARRMRGGEFFSNAADWSGARSQANMYYGPDEGYTQPGYHTSTARPTSDLLADAADWSSSGGQASITHDASGYGFYDNFREDGFY